VFVLSAPVPALEDRVTDERMEVYRLSTEAGSDEDAIQTASLAASRAAGWVVLDGYHFRYGYQRHLKSSGLRTLLIDDYGHAEHYAADLVLNQNICAASSLYHRRESYTRLLLGTQYALLRREFLPWRGWRRDLPTVARKVLVTLGGADQDNVTLRSIRGLKRVEGVELKVKVVIGPANPHGQILRQAAAGSNIDLKLLNNVTDMPRLMGWADVALTGGGTTCWELAFMGLPSVVVILAENQAGIAAALDHAGIALSMGWHHGTSEAGLAKAVVDLLSSRDRRERMSRTGQELVDGGGAGRVVEVLQANFMAPYVRDANPIAGQ